MTRPPLPALVLPLLFGLLLALPTAAQGQEESTTWWGQFRDSVREGTWWLKLRYRFESVDEDPFSSDAHASTLRTVLGYETAPWHGASVLLEFEDVSVVGNERYDSTTNGKTQYPVVADPEGSEVNQVFLRYRGPEETEARLGRQVITLDNQRFVGDVGWRQNQQTYDAARVEWHGVEGLGLLYTFVENVNRVFGDDSPAGDHRMASHLVHGSYEVPEWGRISAYAYLLDYDSVVANSTDTFGARFAGQRGFQPFDLTYALEAASQSDGGDNPNDVDQDYLLLELGGRVRETAIKVGHETLGGSGDPSDAFQTPLATLHGFNGWADKFLVTPDAGLVDVYVSANQALGDVSVQLAWHRFEADSGGADYGTEIDASATWTVTQGVQVGLTLADYDADDFATDTTKLWFWLGFAP